LHNAGLIKTIHDKKSKTYWYEITTAQEYEQLKASINNALDEVLQKIKSIESDKKQLTGSYRLTDASKPANPKNNKGNKQRLSKNEKDKAAE
jgi:ERCC4-related helicase